ncbi:cytochrome P450 [Hygrophoropsis aurantiaca]|uniref:Cytochrome P450 n=1 Tax=Hygrophoropsis aurantiaca TaxID=72124 RepID=A0ACB8AH30_9AGAM|nr:cytochrome P450 [Hygrophoropsis aurantiaca]
MPPGPLGLPWIGNKHQMPALKPWRKFADWNKQYGPVMSIFLGRTPVIVLGTAQASWDLLEKRSDIYSSRPRFVVAGEILSNNNRGLMLPYGEPWRKWRKVLHSGFHARRSDTYRDIQSLESKISLQEILNQPKKWEQHLQRYAASVVTSVSYGRRVNSIDEWIVKENMEAMDYLTSVNIPGKYIVESWPWLLNLPRFLQWFRAEPEERQKRDIKLYTHLLDDVKSRVAKGTIQDCLTTQTLNEMPKNGMDELEVAYAVSSPFGAGIETTAGTLSTFFLAMLHFPEVMKKSQAELDAVVGPDRIPEFHDKESLPYINALINEALRWRPVAVLGGTPHAVTQDDEYNGMFIPKGSTVFANLAGIMHDPVMFPDPDTFRPERFLETTDPRLQTFDLPFGWGRRICPGMHLSLNSLFINISRILWAFDITPIVDNNGKKVIPDSWAYTNGFNSRPVGFDCNIMPRSNKVIDCLNLEYEAAKARLEDWE